LIEINLTRKNVLETALIGLLGVMLGIFLNEQIRRRNRIENYSTSVFEKRLDLDLYEELFRRVSKYMETANIAIKNDTLTKEQRHECISNAIYEVTTFCDEHEMYISEELSVHCVATIMGVEDIYYIEDEKEKEDAVKNFYDDLLAAKRMIRKEAGISDLDKLFRSITKPKYSSPIIKYYRKREKELGVKDKWN
jgi:hypothetical protein